MATIGADHILFMRRAIALAREGKNKGGGAFGAIIVKDGKIVAEGYNEVKALTDCTQHAELSVIQKACKAMGQTTLKGCILYTSCEPCMMCLGACYWAKFLKIYYGASALQAKEYGYVYSDMFYNSHTGKRHTEFNMEQLLAKEAIIIWED